MYEISIQDFKIMLMHQDEEFNDDKTILTFSVENQMSMDSSLVVRSLCRVLRSGSELLD